MPPRLFSRHTFTTAQKDEDGNLFLSERVPFGYQSFADNVAHTVGEGDTLFTLAARYFEGVERPEGLWWVIADFQPDPIFDPTLRLTLGQVLVIPSLRTVLERVFAEERRQEAEV